MKRASSVSIEEYILQDWSFDDDSDDVIAVASAIRTWAGPGNWLDLGCGPLLTVWPMFACAETAIWGCDRDAEIAAFHEDLIFRGLGGRRGSLFPAVSFFNRRFSGPGRPPRTRTCIDELRGVVTINLLEQQVAWSEFFHTIVQIGCFGCLDSMTALDRAARLVACYLRPRGRFISATWTPRPGYVESQRWGGVAIATVSADVLCSSLRQAGLAVLKVHAASIDDPHYASRYIIVAEKPDPRPRRAAAWNPIP